MKIKLAIIIFLCIIFESLINSYPATLLAITFISIFIEEEAIIWAFAAGILLDFLSLKLLGSDSLYYLVTIYLGTRYKKKIHGGTFAYRFIYIMLTFVIYNLLFYKNLNISGILVTALIGIILLTWFDRILPHAGNKKRLIL